MLMLSLTISQNQNSPPLSLPFPLSTAPPPPMSISTAALVGSASLRLVSLPHLRASDKNVSSSSLSSSNLSFPYFCRRHSSLKKASRSSLKVSLSDGAAASKTEEEAIDPAQEESFDSSQIARRSADWQTARMYSERGLIYEGRVEAFNTGGLLLRFYSLLGFLPFPQLSRSHSCREPHKSPQEIARALIGSFICVKVLQADEEKRKLILSEKEAMWSRYSQRVNVGDVFEARVGAIEDYGAFAHLRFPDGNYYLSGLIHVSEVSWDFVQDVRDVLTEGEDVRVKILTIDRAKSRITLSIKQLEEDPLLETLEKVIPQDGSAVPNVDGRDGYDIEPLPGLELIIEELRQEEGVSDVKITRQGFEKRVVSPDLQLWLSNAPSIGEQFTLLARAGRQVQEIQLVTSLDQEGIKKALQRVLERVP